MNHLITDLPTSIHEKNQETNLISVSMSLINVPDVAIPITREKGGERRDLVSLNIPSIAKPCMSKDILFITDMNNTYSFADLQSRT